MLPEASGRHENGPRLVASEGVLVTELCRVPFTAIGRSTVSEAARDGVGALGIIHVVKCGGMAVRDAVATLPGSYTGPLYFDLGMFWSFDVLDGASPDVRAQVVTDDAYREVVHSNRVAMGHVSASTLDDAGCTAIAVQVREPRSRILSQYRYWAAQTDEARASWGFWGSHILSKSHLSLGEFLSAEEVRPAIDNAISRQCLAGLVSDYPAPTSWAPQPADVNRFLELLEIAEWSTSSDRFLERVWSHLGQAEPPSLGRVNVTEVTGGTQVVDRTARELLDRLTRYDRSLLEHLAAEGALPGRTPSQNDDEFEETAEHLGFKIV
jgi:hypothetical protein